ncbi:MAG: hypothetical protein NTV61_06170 [Candidatus Bathyarchaeota archaeon]|nr:hypothetical protein [Candidatus Bathyarchaeota archaeon]
MIGVSGEDLVVAVILGVSIKIFPIIQDAAASMGLEAPLVLGALMLASVLFASSLWERKRP